MRLKNIEPSVSAQSPRRIVEQTATTNRTFILSPDRLSRDGEHGIFLAYIASIGKKRAATRRITYTLNVRRTGFRLVHDMLPQRTRIQ